MGLAHWRPRRDGSLERRRQAHLLPRPDPSRTEESARMNAPCLGISENPTSRVYPAKCGDSGPIPGATGLGTGSTASCCGCSYGCCRHRQTRGCSRRACRSLGKRPNSSRCSGQGLSFPRSVLERLHHECSLTERAARDDAQSFRMGPARLPNLRDLPASNSERRSLLQVNSVAGSNP